MSDSLSPLNDPRPPSIADLDTCTHCTAGLILNEPETAAHECAAARERSVAGLSDLIPACLFHGPYDETDSAASTDVYWRNYRNGEGE
jgi:hypothetical protein